MKKLLILIVALGLSACATHRQERAATTGAAVGGVAGTIIGADSGQPLEGAIFGAIAGAVAGAIIAAPDSSAYYGRHHHGDGHWHHHHGDGNYNHRHRESYYRGHVYYAPAPVRHVSRPMVIEKKEPHRSTYVYKREEPARHEQAAPKARQLYAQRQQSRYDNRNSESRKPQRHEYRSGRSDDRRDERRKNHD